MRSGELQPDPDLKPGRGQIVKVRGNWNQLSVCSFYSQLQRQRVNSRWTVLFLCVSGGRSVVKALDSDPQLRDEPLRVHRTSFQGIMLVTTHWPAAAHIHVSNSFYRLGCQYWIYSWEVSVAYTLRSLLCSFSLFQFAPCEVWLYYSVFNFNPAVAAEVGLLSCYSPDACCHTSFW